MKLFWRNSSKFALLGILALGSSVPLAGQSSQVQRRLTEPIDENNLVTLGGNVHRRAIGKNDRGAAPDSMMVHRMVLMLKRTPEQETALQQLIDAQHTKGSSSFHQWLTPKQFGAQFGAADDDIQTVSGWLELHGFVVAGVSPSKMSIEFAGTAGQVKNAFHTEIHKFVSANGEEHWANATDPQIPAALAPVVRGTVSLHNFEKKPMVKTVGIFSKDKSTGKVTPKATSNFEIANCGPLGTCNALAPADFNTIYDVPNTLDGTGVTIAITGDSEICTASSPDFSECNGNDDVASFRSLFGLNAGNLPKVILAGPDAGFTADETEGDLDNEWAGAIAPNAQVLFVIGQNTEATAGIDLAAEYIVDNNLAPVLSESFGACEAILTANENQFYETLWEQATAQGMTVVISAGDSGAAGCDNPNQESIAQDGLQVNGIASTPFNTAAGGTDFNVSVPNYQSTFWSATNNATTKQSALSYIPETTWNDSCAQTGVTGCNGLGGGSNQVNIVGGGGGESNCAFGQVQCAGGYAKPSWQTGAGVPNDSVRDVPDISLFAADGARSGSFYIVCQADLNPAGAPCSLTAPFPFADFVGVGGTSAAAPTFAAIMALLNQSTGQRQGNVNYTLYSMAANQPPAFHDITVGNNSVPCTFNPANFLNNIAADCSTASGIGLLEPPNSSGTSLQALPAFSAGAGYDLATGLGSVDAAKLISLWTGGGTTGTTTTIANPAGPLTITHGQNQAFTITVSPAPPNNANNPEAVALIGTCMPANPNCFTVGVTSNTAGANRFTSTNYTVSTNVFTLNASGQAINSTSALIGCIPLAGQTSCSYLLTAHYPGDGTLRASDSAPITVTVNPQPSQVQVTAINDNLNCSQNCLTTATTEPYGSLNLIRVDVLPQFGALQNATGTVTIADTAANCASAICGTFSLNPEGYAEAQTPNLSFPGNLSQLGIPLLPALSVGAHSFSATYSGDGSYKSGSSATHAAVTITTAPTATAITSIPSTVSSGVSFQVSAFVDTNSIGVAPTGTVTFFNGGTQVGNPVNVTATADANGFVAASASTMLTLTSGVALVATPRNRPFEWIPVIAFGFALLCGLLLLIVPMRRRLALAGLTLVILGLGIGIAGCGGGGSSNTPAPGTADVTARFSGDGNYQGSSSTISIVTVH